MPNKPRPKVIVTRRLPQAVETRMAELFDVELNLTDTPFTQEQLCTAARNCDVLVPTVTDHVDAAVFAAAAEGGRLKLCANFGVGVDHIDLHAAHAAKVTVTNTPGVLTEDTADMVMALILAVPRRLGAGEKLVRAGEWAGWSPTGMLGHRITGIARTRAEAIALGRADAPDLILADIQLADNSSGIDAVNDLLTELGHRPVIFITAFPERLLTGDKPEPAFLISKPYTEDQVISAVSQAMFFSSTETLHS